MPRHLGSIIIACHALALAIATAPFAFAQNEEFRSRLEAWQQPRSVRASHPAAMPTTQASEPVLQVAYHEEHELPVDPEADGCGNCACDGGCGGTCGGDCGWEFAGNDPGCQACMSCRPPMWWFRSDGLLWWRKGRDLPVLVTSSTVAVPPPGDIVLYGGELESGSPQGGARIDFGTWLDPEECLGVGGRFWGIGKERTRFSADSDRLPDQTIERPFVDVTGDPNSLVVADPFTPFDGSIQVVTNSEVFGADVYTRMSWCRMCDFRVDLVGGYQFSRINEELHIDSSTQNATLLVSDNWVTRNEFHGGSIGILYESYHGCWTTTCLAKVGLGSMRQTAVLTGFENGQPGGLLVEAPITVTRDKFAAVPELDVAWSYAINDCWSMNVGYSLMYWSNVARPESLIDFVQGDGNSIVFRDDSFWVQGLTVGTSCRF